ncbi:hypothetical protein GF325_05015 [Candidatus Bathyarchaeota archaeon]|nr:hypothetical protein [Candidatus Bathyarchaeota archaeon]
MTFQKINVYQDLACRILPLITNGINVGILAFPILHALVTDFCIVQFNYNVNVNVGDSSPRKLNIPASIYTHYTLVTRIDTMKYGLNML